MAWRQLAHRLEERAGGGRRTDARQIGRHRGLVEPVADELHGKDGFHGAGEDEAFRCHGVVERSRADMIPGADENALLRVPYGESVVAEQVVGTIPIPAPVGPQDEVAVGETGTFGMGNAECAAKLLPVVQTGIRGHGEARTGIRADRPCAACA